MRERELFLEARQISDPLQRWEYLTRVCAGDSDLLQRVEALLRLDEAAAGVLEPVTLPVTSHAQTGQPSNTPLPARIGPYKLLEPIGEGGMGTVYMAEQTHPVKRRVALKVIKSGMDSKLVLARFAAERQALALMDHPNIAKVLDAGSTDTGRPFFVMELVQGTPITPYCDARRLTPRERLELFIPVCQAVQHAHQKGVIHRDLKPSNILVGIYDGRPIPKIIDFGVAKATGPILTEETLFTAFGTIIGTPEYMSPEQAQLDNVDIDTRADVYSLGVLLYELLTGTTPLLRSRLRDSALLEILRRIREEEPAKPSTRLSASEELPTIALNRGVEPQRLARLICGDLDWIVMTALEKDRSRRYETANGLAADLRRYLDGDPISACPPSNVYRIRKLATKHRGLLATAATVGALVLILAIGGVSWALHADGQRRQIDRVNNVLERTNTELITLSQQEYEARLEAQKRLREALLVTARAGRWSGEMGRRFDGLAALEEAARLKPGDDIRDEAIACLSLVDMRPIDRWEVTNRKSGLGAFDANLVHAVWVSEDNELVMERVEDHREVLQLPSLGRFANSWWMQLSPCRRWLSLTYGSGGTESFVVWDLRTRTIRLEVPNRGEQDVDYSADGSRIAFRAPDDSIQIHDLERDAVRLRIDDHGLGEPAYFKFHPTRPILAVAAPMSRDVALFDTERGTLLNTLPLGGEGRYLAWNRDGSLLAVSVDREIAVFHVPTSRRLSTLKGHQALVCFLRFHPMENLLVSDSWDDTFRIWDPLSGEELVRAPGYCRGISKDGTKIAYYHMFHAGVNELAPGVERRAMRERVDMPGNHRDLRFETTGRLLVSGHDYGASIWDLATFSQLCELPLGDVFEMAWLERCRSMVTSGDSGLMRWPVMMDEASRTFRVGPPAPIGPPLTGVPGNCVTDGAGLILFVTVTGTGVQILDTSANQRLHELKRISGEVALSPDSRFFACAQAFSQGEVTIWDGRTFEPITVLPGLSGVRVSIDFSPDSARLIVSDQQRMRLFETESWSMLWERERAPGVGSNFMVSISPDGYHLATLEQGVKIRLFELETARPLATLESDTDMLTDMVFSPNGSLLAAMGGGLTIHMWDLHALRAGLARMNLDWDGPEIPPPPVFTVERTAPPFLVEVDYGDPESHPEGSPIHRAALESRTSPIRRSPLSSRSDTSSD